MTDNYPDFGRNPERALPGHSSSRPNKSDSSRPSFQELVRTLAKFAVDLEPLYLHGDHLICESTTTVVVDLGDPENPDNKVGVTVMTDGGEEVGTRRIGDDEASHWRFEGGVGRSNSMGPEEDRPDIDPRAWVGERLWDLVGLTQSDPDLFTVERARVGV